MLLDVQGVHVGYGDVPVLHDVTFHLDMGEIITIVGPNGAGNTTLLRTLSGGEQQMLATARALMAWPTLLMLAEPSWGFAPMTARRLFESIEEINRQGVTILLVEQNVHRALSLPHRAYVLERGSLVMQGSAQVLPEHPGLRAAYIRNIRAAARHRHLAFI